MVSVVFAYADVMLKSFAVGLSVALSAPNPNPNPDPDPNPNPNQVGLSVALSALASEALFHTACSPQACS